VIAGLRMFAKIDDDDNNNTKIYFYRVQSHFSSFSVFLVFAIKWKDNFFLKKKYNLTLSFFFFFFYLPTSVHHRIIFFLLLSFLQGKKHDMEEQNNDLDNRHRIIIPFDYDIERALNEANFNELCSLLNEHGGDVNSFITLHNGLVMSPLERFITLGRADLVAVVLDSPEALKFSFHEVRHWLSFLLISSESRAVEVYNVLLNHPKTVMHTFTEQLHNTMIPHFHMIAGNINVGLDILDIAIATGRLFNVRNRCRTVRYSNDFKTILRSDSYTTPMEYAREHKNEKFEQRLKLYLLRPNSETHKSRLKLGTYKRANAATLLTAVRLVDTEQLAVCEDSTVSGLSSFISLVKRFPLELQMRLCNDAMNVTETHFVSQRDMEMATFAETSKYA